MTPKLIYLPCGSSARWDSESDMGYRCTSCFAMVGSIGQPKQCVDMSTEYNISEKMGGPGWDYTRGEQTA
jgi:hypothetical protein